MEEPPRRAGGVSPPVPLINENALFIIVTRGLTPPARRALNRVLLAGVVCCVLWGCLGANSSSETQRLTLTGSSTIAPLAAEMAKRFEDQHPGVRIDVQTGGSSRGLADTKTGQADIGMVSRALTEDERQTHVAYPIARDGVCLIVHQSNPIQELTNAQVVAIYQKEITNWQEVGGIDLPIVVVHKAEGRSTLELFLAHFGLSNEAVRPDSIIGDNQQGIKLVAQSPGAIGYVSIGTAQYDAEHGVPIKLLPINGITATVEHVADGTFPLARPLNFVTATDADEKLSKTARQFLDFAQSDEVRDLVEGLQFVPLRQR